MSASRSARRNSISTLLEMVGALIDVGDEVATASSRPLAAATTRRQVGQL
jgi:hypothetical protein